jgi:hypothetical protein
MSIISFYHLTKNQQYEAIKIAGNIIACGAGCAFIFLTEGYSIEGYKQHSFRYYYNIRCKGAKDQPVVRL